MKKVNFICSAIFLIIIILCEAEKEEGARCESLTGFGRCVALTDCQPALDGLLSEEEEEEESPNFCNPDNYEPSDDYFNPLVCCASQQHYHARIQERISNQKCKQYHPLHPVSTRPENDFHQKALVRGRKALSKEYRHMALIGYGTVEETIWLCGGSLISEQFILTAAHCIDTNRGSPIVVRLGELDTASSIDDADPTDFDVARAVAHPEYTNSPSNYHDIGLIELSTVATFNDYIQPICLHQGGFDVEFLSAAGWGDTAFLGSSSAHLMVVDLKVVNNSECNKFYKGQSGRVLPNGIMDSLQICVGGNDGRDTCQGDSGGPLQVERSEVESDHHVGKIHDLVGITSFGTGCGLGNIPGVYTRVSAYLDWIESIVWPRSD